MVILVSYIKWMVQDPWQIETEAFPNNSNLLKTQMTILSLEQTNYRILVLHNTKFCELLCI